jgi:hypothetical protein
VRVTCPRCKNEFSTEKRSYQANRYWQGVVVPIFQEIWGRGRAKLKLPPYTKQQVHDVLVQAWAGTEDGPLPGTRVRVSTADTDVKTFYALTEWARGLAWDEYQVRIPEANEPPRDEQRGDCGIHADSNAGGKNARTK